MEIRDQILELLQNPTPRNRKRAMLMVFWHFDTDTEEQAWDIVWYFLAETLESPVYDEAGKEVV